MMDMEYVIIKYTLRLFSLSCYVFLQDSAHFLSTTAQEALGYFNYKTTTVRILGLLYSTH